MSAHGHLDAERSRSGVVVWVEDELTKAYLTALWEDKDVTCRFAGGAQAVRGIVRDSADGWVFGIVDRDFGPTNFDRWSVPLDDPTVYRLPVFEIENYLLDFDLIATCRANYAGRNADEIRAKAESQAEAMPAWLACRDVLASFRGRLIGDFPEHPAMNSIASLRDAEAHIERQEWFRELETRAREVRADLGHKLASAEALRQQQKASGDWTRTFPGKEVFRTVRGFVTQVPGRTREGTAAQEDIDLARAIAERQRSSNRVPDDLRILHESLVRRVGLV